MDNTCKNCKFWERNEGHAFGQCRANIATLYSIKEIGMRTEEERDKVLKDIIGVESHYLLPIYYGQDFGCIHFETKEPEIEEKRFVIENYSQYYKYLKKDQINICGAGQAYSRLVEELGSPFAIIERYREGKLHGRSFKPKEAKQ